MITNISSTCIVCCTLSFLVISYAVFVWSGRIFDRRIQKAVLNTFHPVESSPQSEAWNSPIRGAARSSHEDISYAQHAAHETFAPITSTNDVSSRGSLSECAKLRGPPDYDHGIFFDTQYKFHPLIAKLPEDAEYKQLIPFLTKLVMGKPVRVVVLGGSETAGVGCVQKLQGANRQDLRLKTCSWPARLRQWMQAAHPTAKVRLDNTAQGGSTTSVILAGLSLVLDRHRDADADLIIIDTLVNDAGESKKWLAGRRIQLSAAETVSVSYEQLIRTLHDILPDTPVLAFMAGCPLSQQFREHQLKIAKHYRLPVLDYAEIAQQSPLRPLEGHPKWEENELWPQTWDGTRGKPLSGHPTWEGHQMIADAFAFVLTRAWKSSCAHGAAPRFFPSQAFWPMQKLEMFEICTEPKSVYSAKHPRTLKPQLISGNWTLYADRPGKPGWISDVPGSTLRFKLSFGNVPRLVVTWLKSYNNMGKVNMKVNAQHFVLDGLWEDDLNGKVSQSFSMWFQMNLNQKQAMLGDAGLNGFGIKPNTVVDVDMVLLPAGGKHSSDKQKFKIMNVLTC